MARVESMNLSVARIVICGGSRRIKARIFGMGLVLFAETGVYAGHLYVKLVDEREQAVAGAKFYMKLPQESGFEPVDRSGRQEGAGRLVRHEYGWAFNYRLGRSGSVPPRTFEMKVVAPGYEPQTWSQVWPNEEEHIVVTLREERTHGRPNTIPEPEQRSRPPPVDAQQPPPPTGPPPSAPTTRREVDFTGDWRGLVRGREVHLSIVSGETAEFGYEGERMAARVVARTSRTVYLWMAERASLLSVTVGPDGASLLWLDEGAVRVAELRRQ
jgi:hypothetical protein